MPPPGLPRPKLQHRSRSQRRSKLLWTRPRTRIRIPAGLRSTGSIAPNTAMRSAICWRSISSPARSLPVDDSGYGFDNIADVLSLSPALLERYMSAARLVSALAVGDMKMKPAEEQFTPLRDPPSNFRAARGNRTSE